MFVSFVLFAVLSLVDPFVGTGGSGHCTPAATVPFGAVQPGPDTGEHGWKHCSGYHADDRTILGFSSTHLSGTGCGDLGDVRLVPFLGESPEQPLAFDKADEIATPGYYGVRLSNGIFAEMTATTHAGVFRFTFPRGEPRRLIVDLQSGLMVFSSNEKRVISCDSEITSRTLTAALDINCWTRRKLFVNLRFADEAISIRKLKARHRAEKAPRYELDFGIASEGENSLILVTGLSSRTREGARCAADEVGDFDFDRVARAAAECWRTALSRVSVEGDARTRRLFVTSLYHLLCGLNVVSDPGEDVRYSELSLWDTYRAAHPFLTLAYPEVVDGIAETLMAGYRAQGYLPVWNLKGHETNCMIGNPAVSVLADAILKNLTRASPEEALQAMADSLLKPRARSRGDLTARIGYQPFDEVPVESVSRTLEDAVHAAGAARLARRFALDATPFEALQMSYTNLFDRSTGFFRAKDSSGLWRKNFDPMRLSHGDSSLGGDYTEANAWQYLWHVQHDPDGLAALLGGHETALAKLDAFYSLTLPKTEKLEDVTGLIGLSAHGNEPCHHIPYLYALFGNPERTQELVAELTSDTFYSLANDGLSGNEDCGQMSAWYLFSALGFYPVDPTSGEYVLGAPQVAGASIGRLTIRRKGEGRFVKRITWRGEIWRKPTISHALLAAGGELVFEMTSVRVAPTRSTDFYVWQRQWSAPVVRAAEEALAAPQSRLYILAEGNVPERFWRHPRVTAVFRIPVRALTDPIVAAEKLFARVSELNHARIQIDADVPERQLARYAELLETLRTQAAAAGRQLHLGATFLPCHLKHDEMKRILAALDEPILQLHGIDPPKTRREHWALMNRKTVFDALRIAEKLDSRFKIALPAYAYVLSFDSKGNFLRLYAEGLSSIRELPPTAEIDLAPPDLQLLADVLSAYPKFPVIWFRLPVPGLDRWSLARETIDALTRGECPEPSVEILKIPGRTAGTLDLIAVYHHQIPLKSRTVSLDWGEAESGEFFPLNGARVKDDHVFGSLPRELILPPTACGERLIVAKVILDKPL